MFRSTLDCRGHRPARDRGPDRSRRTPSGRSVRAYHTARGNRLQYVSPVRYVFRRDLMSVRRDEKDGDREPSRCQRGWPGPMRVVDPLGLRDPPLLVRAMTNRRTRHSARWVWAETPGKATKTHLSGRNRPMRSHKVWPGSGQKADRAPGVAVQRPAGACVRAERRGSRSVFCPRHGVLRDGCDLAGMEQHALIVESGSFFLLFPALLRGQARANRALQANERNAIAPMPSSIPIAWGALTRS